MSKLLQYRYRRIGGSFLNVESTDVKSCLKTITEFYRQQANSHNPVPYRLQIWNDKLDKYVSVLNKVVYYIFITNKRTIVRPFESQQHASQWAANTLDSSHTVTFFEFDKHVESLEDLYS